MGRNNNTGGRWLVLLVALLVVALSATAAAAAEEAATAASTFSSSGQTRRRELLLLLGGGSPTAAGGGGSTPRVLRRQLHDAPQPDADGGPPLLPLPQRRALRRRTVKGGKLRAPPSSKKARLVHSFMTAVFLAAGLVVIGLLACCVVRCDALARVCPCICAGARRESGAVEGEEDVEESPGAKDADWRAHVWPGAAEGESKQEEGDAAASVAAAAAAPVLVDSGVAAPVLLQAVASLWAVSAASVLGLFGMSGSSESPTEKGPEADKLQELPRVAEARGREAASTLPQ